MHVWELWISQNQTYKTEKNVRQRVNEKGREGKSMKEKLENAWMKVGKFLFWALVTALCGCLTYMVYVHRRVIVAAIKGEPLPEPPAGAHCHKFCRKK